MTLRIFCSAHTMLVPVQLSGLPNQFYKTDLDNETVIFESPFHLHLPVPEHNFLVPPPRILPVGWEQMCEELPNEVPLTEDLW